MRNRRDGERIRDLDGFHSIVPYVMPKRTEAEISSEERFDVTDLMEYIWGNKVGTAFGEDGPIDPDPDPDPDPTDVATLISPTQGTVLEFGDAGPAIVEDYEQDLRGYLQP